MRYAIVAAAASLLTAALFVIDPYRGDKNGNAPTPVLLANRFIPKGTPGTLIAVKRMYTHTTFPRNEVEEGALADPNFMNGRVTAVDVYPGKQLTDADFRP